MPLEKIDVNKDAKICEQELQKALKDGFFDKHGEEIWDKLEIAITENEELAKSFVSSLQSLSKNTLYQDKIQERSQKHATLIQELTNMIQKEEKWSIIQEHAWFEPVFNENTTDEKITKDVLKILFDWFIEPVHILRMYGIHDDTKITLPSDRKLSFDEQITSSLFGTTTKESQITSVLWIKLSYDLTTAQKEIIFSAYNALIDKLALYCEAWKWVSPITGKSIWKTLSIKQINQSIKYYDTIFQIALDEKVTAEFTTKWKLPKELSSYSTEKKHDILCIVLWQFEKKWRKIDTLRDKRSIDSQEAKVLLETELHKDNQLSWYSSRFIVQKLNAYMINGWCIQIDKNGSISTEGMLDLSKISSNHISIMKKHPLWKTLLEAFEKADEQMKCNRETEMHKIKSRYNLEWLAPNKEQVFLKFLADLDQKNERLAADFKVADEGFNKRAKNDFPKLTNHVWYIPNGAAAWEVRAQIREQGRQRFFGTIEHNIILHQETVAIQYNKFIESSDPKPKRYSTTKILAANENPFFPWVVFDYNKTQASDIVRNSWGEKFIDNAKEMYVDILEWRGRKHLPALWGMIFGIGAVVATRWQILRLASAVPAMRLWSTLPVLTRIWMLWSAYTTWQTLWSITGWAINYAIDKDKIELLKTTWYTDDKWEWISAWAMTTKTLWSILSSWVAFSITGPIWDKLAWIFSQKVHSTVLKWGISFAVDAVVWEIFLEWLMLDPIVNTAVRGADVYYGFGNHVQTWRIKVWTTRTESPESYKKWTIKDMFSAMADAFEEQYTPENIWQIVWQSLAFCAVMKTPQAYKWIKTIYWNARTQQIDNILESNTNQSIAIQAQILDLSKWVNWTIDCEKINALVKEQKKLLLEKWTLLEEMNVIITDNKNRNNDSGKEKSLKLMSLYGVINMDSLSAIKKLEYTASLLNNNKTIDQNQKNIMMGEIDSLLEMYENYKIDKSEASILSSNLFDTQKNINSVQNIENELLLELDWLPETIWIQSWVLNKNYVDWYSKYTKHLESQIKTESDLKKKSELQIDLIYQHINLIKQVQWSWSKWFTPKLAKENLELDCSLGSRSLKKKLDDANLWDIKISFWMPPDHTVSIVTLADWRIIYADAQNWYLWEINIKLEFWAKENWYASDFYAITDFTLIEWKNHDWSKISIREWQKYFIPKYLWISNNWLQNTIWNIHSSVSKKDNKTLTPLINKIRGWKVVQDVYKEKWLTEMNIAEYLNETSKSWLSKNTKLEIWPADMTLDDFISMQESQLQWIYLAKHFNNGVELSLDQFGEQYTTFVETLISKYPADQQSELREEYGLISLDIFAQVESMNSMVQETYISSKIQFESQLESLDKTHKYYKEDKKKLEDKLEDLEKGKTEFSRLLDWTLTMDDFAWIRTFGKLIWLKNIETHMLLITKLTIINTLRKQKPWMEVTQSDIDAYILDQLNNKETLNDTFGIDAMKIPELWSNWPAITLIDRINWLPNTWSELLTDSNKATLKQYVEEHVDALQQGLWLKDIQIYELMSHNIKNLLFQNIADKKLLSWSDHGILHIVQGDIFQSWKMLDQISWLNLKQKMQIKAMLAQMIVDHDMGYNMKTFESMLWKPTDSNPNRNKDIFFQWAKDHPLFGRMYVDAMTPFYRKFFADTDFDAMKVAMLNHSDVTWIDFTNEISALNNSISSSKVAQDAMQSMLQKLISLADCMGVTYVDKLHSLFQTPNMMHLLGQYDYINKNFPSNTEQWIVLLKQVKQQMFDELSYMQKSGKIDKPTADAYRNALEKGMDVSNKKSKNPNWFPLSFNMSSYIYKNSGITMIDNTSGVMKVTLDKQMYDAVADLYTQDVALNNLNKLVLDYGMIETINNQPISWDKNSQDIAIKNAMNTLNETSLDIIVRCRDWSRIKIEVMIDANSSENIAMKENLKKVYAKDMIIKDAFIDLDKALTSDDNLQILKQIATISQQYPDLWTTIQSIIDTTSFTNQEKWDAIKQIRSEKIIQTYRAWSTLDIQINSINDNLKTIEDDMNTSKNEPKKFYESIWKLTDAIKLLHGKINTIMDSNVSKVEKLKQLQIVFRSIGYVHHTMHISHTIAHESKHLKDNLINKQYIAAVWSFATLITAAIIWYGVVLPHLMHFYDITAMFPPNHSLTMVSDFIDILSNKVNMTFTDAQRKYNELKKISDFKQLEITVENQWTFVGNLRNSISVLAWAKTLKLYPQVFNIWKNFDYHLEISENTQVIDLFNHILSKIDIVTNKSDHLKNIYTLLGTLDLSKTIHRDLVHNIHSAVYDSSWFDHDGQEAEVEIWANHWMHTMHMFH